jgi:hypothetical protein
MVEYLQARKAEGRLGGIYCSTHGPADYVARLIETGVFDAIMLAWNPLGFHQQSHAGSRAATGREYEDLDQHRARVFPLAAERGVGLFIMKPFAGGLLCRSKAFPPHDWYAPPGPPVAPADVLRIILEQARRVRGRPRHRLGRGGRRERARRTRAARRLHRAPRPARRRGRVAADLHLQPLRRVRVDLLACPRHPGDVPRRLHLDVG